MDVNLYIAVAVRREKQATGIGRPTRVAIESSYLGLCHKIRRTQSKHGDIYRDRMNLKDGLLPLSF